MNFLLRRSQNVLQEFPILMIAPLESEKAQGDFIGNGKEVFD